MENINLAILAMTPGVGPIKLRRLVEYFGGILKTWEAGKEELLASGCLEETVCNNLVKTREKIDIVKLADQWKRLGIKTVNLWDDDYPELLAATFNPPCLLYYRGILPGNAQKLLAVVGARRATAYGRNVCQMLAGELAAAGVGIVSGGARGIDSCAHMGAVENGYTLAVLANGVDICYPPENAKLLSRIAERGAVVSEYPPGTKPTTGQFPARNRIISGLSRGVLVVEAAERSGALITADFALEEGRDVFAVPGSILSANSKGAHHLIRQGAKLVEKADDILEEYGWQITAPQQDKLPISKDEESVYHILPGDRAITLDEIIEKTNLPVSTATYILLQLQLQGLITEFGGHRYIRTAREVTR